MKTLNNNKHISAFLWKRSFNWTFNDWREIQLRKDPPFFIHYIKSFFISHHSTEIWFESVKWRRNHSFQSTENNECCHTMRIFIIIVIILEFVNSNSEGLSGQRVQHNSSSVRSDSENKTLLFCDSAANRACPCQLRWIFHILTYLSTWRKWIEH